MGRIGICYVGRAWHLPSQQTRTTDSASSVGKLDSEGSGDGNTIWSPQGQDRWAANDSNYLKMSKVGD